MKQRWLAQLSKSGQRESRFADFCINNHVERLTRFFGRFVKNETAAEALGGLSFLLCFLAGMVLFAVVVANVLIMLKK